MRLWAAIVLSMALAGGAGAQTMSIINSPHDLSAGSSGQVRAAVEDQICIFCHTPHNASPVGALWNRSLSPQAYSVYTSRSLDAKPGQPTGASKLCLSCHDGTIALGSVLSQPTPILMSGGVTTLPPGPSNLGTDLRDDHPISFQFDSTLVSKDQHLRDPAALPSAVKLDSNRELQCTTCHDAHNNAFGKFLVTHNTNSELCIACHQMGRTDISGHAQCSSCHQPHTAPSGPYLLRKRTISQTCLSCHDGSVGTTANIASDIHKSFTHDNDPAVDPSGPANAAMSCASCHEPHTMGHGTSPLPPSVLGPRPTVFQRLGQVEGVSVSGATLKPATAEHEVCFKCHGDQNPVQPTIARRQQQTNMRLQFSPSAISFHPVGIAGRSSDVPSLRPGWNVSSTMECSDCHGSESGTTAGEHGSNVRGLLVANLSTLDNSSESSNSYALCYRCHDRTSILSDRSFSEHKKHIVDERTPCTVCHDSHGIASSNGSATGNAHLVNFSTSVVFPERSTGRLEYQSLGANRGQCFLSCHGENHAGTSYPGGLADNALPKPATLRNKR